VDISIYAMAVYLIYLSVSDLLSTNHPRKDQNGREKKNRLLTCFTCFEVVHSDAVPVLVLCDKTFMIFVTLGVVEIVYSLMGPWGEIGCLNRLLNRK